MLENQSHKEENFIENKIENLSLEDSDDSQIKEKLSNLLLYLETELNLNNNPEKSNYEKDPEPVEKLFNLSPANNKKKLNQTFFMFEKNLKLEEKKEIFKLNTNKNCILKNNGNSNDSMQAENPNFLFTSASPKKKEPKNIQLRKQENVNTFTKSNSLSTNSFNNSKNLNNKLLNIEQRLKAYLKESHKFFKTKSIDQFLENSESFKGFNTQAQPISVPDFEKFSNPSLHQSNQSFKGANGDSALKSNSKAFPNLLCNHTLNNNNNNSILSNASKNFGNNNAQIVNNNNNNASGIFKRQNQHHQLNSNVSSINYSTNYHKALNSTTPFNNSNGTIPSIFKNFFEEKEVKELNKKRHSMAVGQLLHNKALKNPNFSDCEFKQKYQSNHTANNSDNLAKLNLFLRENENSSGSGSGIKESRISDFSVDINFDLINNSESNNNNLNSDSNEDSLIQGLQAGEGNIRTGSFKIVKRNSILRERRVSCRTNGFFMNSFDVVVEEEKNAFGTNTSEDEDSEVEENEKRSEA